MSLTTNFNFRAFQCDMGREVVAEKQSVSLSAMTALEMEEIGFVEVKVKLGFEERSAPWRPVVNPKTGESQATFWDTRMGNFDVKSFPRQDCSTCTAASGEVGGKGFDAFKSGASRCQGHFGYISMPERSPDNWLLVYNPILFSDLLGLLQAECFFCKKFRANDWETVRFECALELVDVGLLGEAFHLLKMFPKRTISDSKETARALRDPEAKSLHSISDIREHVAAVIERSRKFDPVFQQTQKMNKSNNGDGSATEAGGGDETAEGNGAEVVPAAPKVESTGVHPSIVDVRSRLVQDLLKELKAASNRCSHCHGLNPRLGGKNGQIYYKFSDKANENNLTANLVTQQQINDWKAERELHSRERSLLSTDEACLMMERLCFHHEDLIGRLFPKLGTATVDIPVKNELAPHEAYRVFFLDRLLVPPLQIRLASGIQISASGAISPDDRTRDLNDILKYVEEMETYYKIAAQQGAKVTARMMMAHESNLKSLQLKVDGAYAAVLNAFSKKEGLFRMHMMGKRVNQACRSVISPDFTVEPNEVLLPRIFAKNLSYPEQLTNYNPDRLKLLRQCIINGPLKYPGASHIERRTDDGKVAIATLDSRDSLESRVSIADLYITLMTNSQVTVHRHVLDGDRLIFNRQPTLHRVSMLSYRARVLSHLKTLRFHYVNGKSFNADFDGDEMNVHVPQSLECRAELETLMDSNMHFLIATSGRPIRGLIQDHLAAGVLMTNMDSFFDYHQFTQLLYCALEPYITQGRVPSFRSLIPFPAMLKPKPVWTGKQMVSVILKWLTGVYEGNTGVSARGRAQVPSNAWDLRDRANSGNAPGTINDEHTVVFQNSEMLCGVLDKAQLGPTHMSVPHLILEMYGPHPVGDFFGAIGRLLTIYLRTQGMSMGCDDMLLTDPEGRSKQLKGLDECALKLDSEVDAMQEIQKRSSNLINEYIPGKLQVPFPKNQLILMTISGAKGSNVNATQMALVLGQQLFDGSRVKRMSSGKTLPGFFCGEQRARSHGYAMGRFLSGIRPQEYTIHATAGRDGLIDTGIKTSRSGHLQRCLIKGLESLTVHWDGTVRDSDGSVAQFCYGGDGMDPLRCSTLSEWGAIAANSDDYARRYGVNTEGDDDDTAAAYNADKDAKVGQKRGREAMLPSADDDDDDEGWFTDDDDDSGEADDFDDVDPDDIPAELLPKNAAALSNEDAYDSFGSDDEVQPAARRAKAKGKKVTWGEPEALPLPTHLKKSLYATEIRHPLDPKVVDRSRRRGRSLDDTRKAYGDAKKAVVEEITKKKMPHCKVDPGEAVGILAAQACGEPSTQMTLNTFHQAGQTASHVSEGIPRLRELMIHASVSKPAVVVPVTNMQPGDSEIVERIVGVACPVKLESALADISEPYKWVMHRSEHSTTVSMMMVFSESKMKEVAEQLLLSPAEHALSFRSGLRKFAATLVKALKGVLGQPSRVRGGAASGGVVDAVADPAELDPEEIDLADQLDEEDSDAESNRGRANARGEVDVNKTLGRDDMDSDEDSSSQDDSSIDEDALDAAESFERDAEEDATPVPAAKADLRRSVQKGKRDLVQEAALNESLDAAALMGREPADEEEKKFNMVTYRSFEKVEARYFKGSARVDIQPSASIPVAASSPNQNEEGEFFAIDMMISLPAGTVAVIPLAIEQALAEATFPVKNPQFDVARWVPHKNGTQGELIFQGPGTSLKDVMRLLSTVAGDCEAVKIYKATNTNYNDLVKSLGIEGAYTGLLKELEKLFSRYSVDSRHLSLIADTATRRGKWESYNFNGLISHDPSPIFQMTFASSTRFLHHAVSRGVPDSLTSLSSAIVVGEKPHVGTACVSVGMVGEVFERYDAKPGAEKPHVLSAKEEAKMIAAVTKDVKKSRPPKKKD